MNSKSLKIRIKISIKPWMKIIFLIIAYFIGQQKAYKEKYVSEEIIMPKGRDRTYAIDSIEDNSSIVYT